MTQKIIDALKKLDTANDNHWTTDGQPRLDTVKMLASDQSITRDMLNTAAPGFSRANATTWTAPTEGEKQPAQAVQQESQGGNDGQPQNAAPAGGTQPAAGDTVASEAQPSQVEDAGRPVDDSLEALEAELEKASEYVQHLREARVKLQDEFDKMLQVESDLRARVERARPHGTHTDAIRGYLDSQVRNLEARAERRKALAESGVSLGEVLRGVAQAPIDAARARKK